MKRLIFLFSLLPANSFCQTGTITGSAFWKYNDYVGNKADAGSDIYLYTPTRSAPTTTQCDFQGNFKFDNLRPGEYLVVIKSKNATDDWEENFIHLRYCRSNPYLGFQLDSLDKTLCDSVEVYRNYYYETRAQKLNVWKANKQAKQLKAVKDAYTGCIQRLVGLVPKDIKPYFDLELYQTYPHKIFIKEVTVSPNQSTTVIADFGVTYL